MATNEQKWENALMREHDRNPAPFNPNYNPDAVKRNELYQKELLEYGNSLDSGLSDKDMISDVDFDIAIQKKQDELAVKYKVDHMMFPEMFIKAVSYATFNTSSVLDKKAGLHIGLHKSLFGSAKDSTAYEVPKRIKQFMHGKKFDGDQIILVDDCMVVLNDDLKSGTIYFVEGSIEEMLKEAQSKIDALLAEEPLFPAEKSITEKSITEESATTPKMK